MTNNEPYTAPNSSLRTHLRFKTRNATNPARATKAISRFRPLSMGFPPSLFFSFTIRIEARDSVIRPTTMLKLSSFCCRLESRYTRRVETAFPASIEKHSLSSRVRAVSRSIEMARPKIMLKRMKVIPRSKGIPDS